MTYRDRAPLEVEETALANELATLEKRANEVRTALGSAQAKKRWSRSLPLLARTKVASPCSARWEDMVGDDKSRFCGSCGKNVYDLSAMMAAEAEELLAAATKEGNLCIRFYQRADGTILTQDCPVGRRRKRVAWAAGAAALLGAGAAYAGLVAAVRPAPSLASESTEAPPAVVHQGVPMFVDGVGNASSTPPPPLAPTGAEGTYTMGRLAAEPRRAASVPGRAPAAPRR